MWYYLHVYFIPSPIPPGSSKVDVKTPPDSYLAQFFFLHIESFLSLFILIMNFS